MRLLITLMSLFFLALAGGILALIVGMQYFSRDLPDYSSLKDYEPPVLTRIHAGDGRLMAEYATERRLFVPASAMPKLVKSAFLSAEDKDFYRHAGVDFDSIIRAGLTNLRDVGSGKRPIGASTITQQVARNFFLTNEVSYQRKIREILLAFRLERVLTKDRILELYLNQIFLGERSYGVAAAALSYFDKSLDELTIAQCAYLASLPKAPSNYNPVQHKEAALARRNWVIGRMADDGYITDAQAQEAVKEDLVIIPKNDDEVVEADYFADEVRRELTARYGQDAVLGGGLYVRTSLDPQLQQYADAALRAGLETYDRRHGYRGPVAHNIAIDSWPAQLKTIAMPAGAADGQNAWELAAVSAVSPTQIDILLGHGNVAARATIAKADFAWAMRGDKLPLARGDVILVGKQVSDKDKKVTYQLKQVPQVQGALVAMDPNTGRVLAMTGGYSHQISVFNRVTQAQRQPGSSFKPFVYMAGLDNGFSPSSLVLDGPLELPQGPGLPMWRPENYEHDFLGPATLRVGVEHSRNLMTIRLAHAIGMDKVADIAQRFGITDRLPPYLSSAIGAIETTPLRMATAYAMIVNGGKKISPSLIDMVQDRRGQTIWRQQNRLCTACVDLSWNDALQVPEIPDARQQIEDPRTTGQMVSILEGVVQRGTAAALKKDLDFAVAGKTGTTNESKDVWFIGFTPDLVAAVFVGYDDPQSLGKHETGASAAVPIFGQFMKNAMQNRPKVPFRVPDGLRFVRIDPKTGHEVDPGTPGAIWEGYKPGTEPGVMPQTVLDGSAAVDPNAANDNAADDGTVEEEEAPPAVGAGIGAGAVIEAPTSAGVVDNSITAPQPGQTPSYIPPATRAPAPAAVQGTGGLY